MSTVDTDPHTSNDGQRWIRIAGIAGIAHAVTPVWLGAAGCLLGVLNVLRTLDLRR
jgi:hypothetical protein